MQIGGVLITSLYISVFVDVSTALFILAHLQVYVHSDYVMYTFHILKFNLTDRLFLKY